MPIKCEPLDERFLNRLRPARHSGINFGAVVNRLLKQGLGSVDLWRIPSRRAVLLTLRKISFGPAVKNRGAAVTRAPAAGFSPPCG